MNWRLPNQLTVARIALAGAFFTLLGLYELPTPTQPHTSGRWLLNIAFVVYLIAGVTDVLDGYLARKWNIVSAFGRIADPFVDKVLVVGAFAMLAGSNFALPPEAHAQRIAPGWATGHMASAVQAWMVVVILCREFLISAMRGYSESQGVKFPATSAGKIKMFVQSAAICTALYQMANLPEAPWAIYTRTILVWLAVAITALSGLAYVGKARRVFRRTEKD